MQQLTGVDANFLYMESPTTFGHVSSLIIYEGADAEGATYEKAQELFRERLHLLDPMRRKLVEVPFNLDHPYWIEDPDLDLDFHIRQTAVPPPGTDEQLAELVARLIARPLDRSRPLWELYVIYGLPNGRIAQLTKIHHATIDGVGGAQLLMNILDLDEKGRVVEPQPLPPAEKAPSEMQMLGRGLASLATQPYKQGRLAIKLLNQVPQIAGATSLGDTLALASRLLPEPVQRLVGQGERRVEDDVPDLSSSSGISAPPTPFNAKIGPHRKFAFTSVSLDDIKSVKNALGVTVNDVVLGMCAGALRTYLDKHGALPEESLRTMIPVSVRSADQANTYGNQVSGMMADLHTNEPDPVRRLQLINESTKSAKETLGALPADVLTDVQEFLPPVITARASRLVARTQLANRINPPFNLVISNVPGPQIPLYAGGARMLHYYPVSAVADTQGLNITIQSYDGKADFGLVACRALVPDLWDLCHMLEDALVELQEVAGLTRPAKKPAPRKRTAKKAATRKTTARKASTKKATAKK